MLIFGTHVCIVNTETTHQKLQICILLGYCLKLLGTTKVVVYYNPKTNHIGSSSRIRLDEIYIFLLIMSYAPLHFMMITTMVSHLCNLSQSLPQLVNNSFNHTSPNNSQFVCNTRNLFMPHLQKTYLTNYVTLPHPGKSITLQFSKQSSHQAMSYQEYCTKFDQINT